MIYYYYHSAYSMDFGEHVFPVEKYRLIYEKLLNTPGIQQIQFKKARIADDEELALVHKLSYLNELKELTETPEQGYYLFEIPCTEQILDSFYYFTGASIDAAYDALGNKAAANIGGGFHHAFADHGEGFCLINDIAVAIRVLQHNKRIKRAAVIDCDLHQGNGTAKIFENDPTVFTFSIHQEHLYPLKQKSTLDIGLDDLTRDEVYLNKLMKTMPKIFDDFKPELVVYQAGADPYEKDLLGSLKITKEGLRKRDEIVYKQCKKHNVPIIVTLGGGYSADINDTAEIHYNTLTLLNEYFN
ncbi:MAG: histone deacetylase [Planctomycetes bacterium]|nr:histone deacetylase [Planctomycetota bacterium]